VCHSAERAWDAIFDLPFTFRRQIIEHVVLQEKRYHNNEAGYHTEDKPNYKESIL